MAPFDFPGFYSHSRLYTHNWQCVARNIRQETTCSVAFLGLGYSTPHDLSYFLPFTCSRDFQWCLCSYSCAPPMRPLCLNFSGLGLFLCRPHSFSSQTDAEMLGKVKELFFPTARGERFLPRVLGGSVGDSTRFESGLWTGAKGNEIQMPSSPHHPAFSRLLTSFLVSISSSCGIWERLGCGPGPWG